MKAYKKLQSSQRGTILLIFLITLPFLILLAMYYMSLSLTSFQVARFDQLHTAAQMAADAGADYSVEQLAQNSSWTGTGSEITLHNGTNTRTTFTSSITGNSSSKTITVTGKTYWPAKATTASRSVTIAVDLYPVTTGNYSIVAGAGGLSMVGNSKITGGNVFINGAISLANSAQIGLSTNPVNVQVADEVCPLTPDSTYPRVCTSSDKAGQPITISGSAHIYGTVTATNQTSGSSMSNSGLVSGGTVSPQALPTYNRAAQKAAVTSTMTGSQASCSHSQTVTWPANVEITGNVSLSNTCTVTIMGNAWITGSLTTSNSSELIISSANGTTRPNIMVDGSGGVTLNNASSVVANSNGTGAEFYTFWSKASCSPDCTNVTGTDLANSRTQTTVNLGNSGSAPNSIFYAYWSQVQIANAGAIGAVIGQTVNMSNAAAITFGSSTGVGNTTWIIKGYRRVP